MGSLAPPEKNRLGSAYVSDVTLRYSSFRPTQKILLAYAASVSAMFSGLSSFIYYLAITALTESLHASTEAINFTITSYLIVAGIAPSTLGDMADHTGRPPFSLLALILYFSANLGLALQNNYAALLVLRCLQSAGASSTIALAYGIISDISIPAERGLYMAILMGLTNSVASLGPVIGGTLAGKLSWHWIFWLPAIIFGLHFLALLIFLSEMALNLVRNSDGPPVRLVNRSILNTVFPHHLTSSTVVITPPPFSLPNPFSCLRHVFQRSRFIVLVVGRLQYTIFG